MRLALCLLFVVSKCVVKAENVTRSGKLLSIFSVVQFKNTECLSNSTYGLCVTAKEVAIDTYIREMLSKAFKNFFFIVSTHSSGFC